MFTRQAPIQHLLITGQPTSSCLDWLTLLQNRRIETLLKVLYWNFQCSDILRDVLLQVINLWCLCVIHLDISLSIFFLLYICSLLSFFLACSSIFSLLVFLSVGKFVNSINYGHNLQPICELLLFLLGKWLLKH